MSSIPFWQRPLVQGMFRVAARSRFTCKRGIQRFAVFVSRFIAAMTVHDSPDKLDHGTFTTIMIVRAMKPALLF
jgi:hypothetical protein